MDPVYNVAVKEGQILWADLNVMWKSDWFGTLADASNKRLGIVKAGSLIIRFKTDFFLLPAVLSLLLLYNKSFSTICHVDHAESGHSVCHHTEKESKLGLKLTKHVHRPICCSACFYSYDHMMVYLKTLSTSFHIISEYTFYQVFLYRVILLLVWWLFLACHQLAQLTQNAGTL